MHRHYPAALGAGAAAAGPRPGHAARPPDQPGQRADAGQPARLRPATADAAADPQEDPCQGVLARREARRPSHPAQTAERDA